MTNTMKYGAELIATLEREIEAIKEQIRNRNERIANWQTDEDDCFISQRVDERGIRLAQNKIALLKDGGCAWFEEYATLDGTLVDARWCETRYGLKLRVEMPDGGRHQKWWNRRPRRTAPRPCHLSDTLRHLK